MRYRTIDASSYAEIATVDVERCVEGCEGRAGCVSSFTCLLTLNPICTLLFHRSVLDIAVEPSDWMICLATLDVADTSAMSSTVSYYLDEFPLFAREIQPTFKPSLGCH